MRTLAARLGLALLFLSATTAAFAQEFQSEVEYYRLEAANRAAEPAAAPSSQRYEDRSQIAPEYYREYQLAKIACPEAAQPANAFIVIPQYFNSHNSAGSLDMGHLTYQRNKGRGNGAGVAVAYNRKLSDIFSLTFLYEYAFMKISGGNNYIPGTEMRFDGDSSVYSQFDSRNSNRWDSHILAIATDINFGKWGRFNLSFAQAWDRASGGIHQYGVNSSGEVRSRRDDQDGQGFNISVGQLWYEVDFDFCNNWKLTPYAGWRTIYADIKPTDAGYVWIHLVSGGLKLSYQKDRFGFHIRGGVNHRNTHDDLPTFGTRSVAPGVLHFSHATNQDRTVGTAGLGVSYAAARHLAVAVEYDFFAGKDTTNHMAVLSFIVPF